MKTHILVVAVIIAGTFFRAYMPEAYVFGFDQVQILTHAEAIKNGDLTLIGPRTGPADMFTGPLVYYITAAFLFVTQSPWAIVGMSTLIAGVTGLAVYFLAKKYVAIQSAAVMLVLWAFSPFLIHFDRIAWNPNLSFFASSLVFFPMMGILKKTSVTKTELLFIALGSFLGFQAHFSGLLLPALLLFVLLVSRQKFILPVLASGAGLLLSIAPTLLFDLKNGGLNTKGLLNFLTEDETIGGTLFFDRVIHSIKVTLQIFGSSTPLQLTRDVSIGLGLVFVAVLIWLFIRNYKKESQLEMTIPFIWISIIVLIFSFYRSNSPEYYFFIFLPAVFVLVADLFIKIANIKVLRSISIVILVAVFFNTLTNFSKISGANSSGLRISNQQAMAYDIALYSQKQPVSMIAYDILAVDSLGMRYLIDKTVQFSEEGKVVHIAHQDITNEKYGNYGLWVDPRVSTEHNYLLLDTVLLKTPKDITLLEDRSLGSLFGPHQVFKFTTNNTLTGNMLVVVKKIDNPFIVGNETFKQLTENSVADSTLDGWKTVNSDAYVGYMKDYDSFILVLIPGTDTQTALTALGQIEATKLIPGTL